MVNGKVLVLRVYMESSDYIYDYTGKISKVIVLTEVPELEYMFKPIKGFFKPLRISPPIETGKAVFPYYERKVEEGKVTFNLKPVLLKGKYFIEFGGPNHLIDQVVKSFKNSVNVRTRIKFENALINYVIEDVEVFEPNIEVIDKVEVSSISPSILSNPYTPDQRIRRFSTSPSVVLWIPYLISKGVYSHSGEVYEKLLDLERCLSEHYSTKHNVIFINYGQRREPAMLINAKYVVSSKYPTCRDIVKTALNSARIYGIGASRASGFGSVVVGKSGWRREVK